MNANVNAGPPLPVIEFSLVIELNTEHLYIPKAVSQLLLKCVGNAIELMDPVGNAFQVNLLSGNKGVVMWEVIPMLVALYRLESNYSISFKHESGKSSYSEFECVEEDQVNVNEVDLGKEGVYKFEKRITVSQAKGKQTLEMRLQSGDIVQFETIANGVNFAHVRVLRRGVIVARG
ncbi:EfeM/EfeO family lipoprotein [Sesbania bispinosa]|nr:EfeM/EfeO family lipoprotein [Sesbania bispinosa]